MPRVIRGRGPLQRRQPTFRDCTCPSPFFLLLFFFLSLSPHSLNLYCGQHGRPIVVGKPLSVNHLLFPFLIFPFPPFLTSPICLFYYYFFLLFLFFLSSIPLPFFFSPIHSWSPKKRVSLFYALFYFICEI